MHSFHINAILKNHRGLSLHSKPLLFNPMISHFAELHLSTLSPAGVRQVYHECLGFDVLTETEEEIRIQITPHTVFHFTRSSEPIRPAHLAFEVRHSKWQATRDLIEHAHVPLDGDIETEETHQRYFEDGDGNLLEVYSHSYVNEGVIEPQNPMGVLYLREVGFVVSDLAGFYDWLEDVFQTVHTKGVRDGEIPPRCPFGRAISSRPGLLSHS